MSAFISLCDLSEGGRLSQAFKAVCVGIIRLSLVPRRSAIASGRLSANRRQQNFEVYRTQSSRDLQGGDLAGRRGAIS